MTICLDLYAFIVSHVSLVLPVCRQWSFIFVTHWWYVSKVSIIFDCSMLLYYMFWVLMGLFIHFNIIFGTNLLTQGPVQIAVFLPISVFRRKGIPNGVQTEWNLRERDFWNKRDPEDLEWTSRNQRRGHEAGRRACPLGALPPSWAPHSSTDLLLPPIYTHIPRNQRGAPRNPISTAATFCTREIPSWSLFRRSAGGASITEGFYINTIASPMMCE